MEKEFGALKGLMGVNGLAGSDIVPDIGSIHLVIPVCDSSCGNGCASCCSLGCHDGCPNGSQFGREDR